MLFMIKNVIFDFGGVLLDWNPRYLYRHYFQHADTMEWFLAHVCTLQWNAMQDAGRPLDQGVAVLQREYPQYSRLIALFYERWEEMLYGPIPFGVDLMRACKKQGYHVFGLTNWSDETLGVAFNRYDFFDQMEGIVVSGREKIIKPQPEIYRILLDRYHIEASASLFIDDNEDNLRGAAAVGLQTFLFDGIHRPPLDGLC